MSRLGSYWLLFVIVAVGLALSWGQVGRKAERALQADPVVYLITETPCRPALAPCAAAASDRALVLGPAVKGLVLKQTGLRPGAVLNAEVVFLDAADTEVDRRSLSLDGQAWLLKDIPGEARVLRTRLSGGGEVTVGEFPLR